MPAKKTTILTADDDPQLLRLISRNLQLEGYDVLTASDGQQALELIENNSPDLVLLDVMMPRMDGFTVCYRVREFSSVPIIIITARGQDQDKVRGLDLGADDYLTKPFSVDELLARVRSVLRRSQFTAREYTQGQRATTATGGLVIDYSQHIVTLNRREIALTPTEYSIIAYLAQNVGRVVTQDLLLEHVWGPEYLGESHMLQVNINRLRDKLEVDATQPRYILTKVGVGYSLAALDIINPYIVGNPVTGPEMFFGREDVFHSIHEMLVGQHRDNVVVLYGQRRTGKTSVLYQMRYHLDKERYLCILVDLQGLAFENLEGLRDFLLGLADSIKRDLRRVYQIDLPNLNRPAFMSDPRNAFESEFLSKVWSAIGDRHILLMIDEAGLLQELVQAKKLEREVFAYLRYLVQHYEQLNFIFSLGSGLAELQQEYALLFSAGLNKEISYLDRDAAIDLITNPVAGRYRFEPATLERILQITSGHPYYIQLLCHSLFLHWGKQPPFSHIIQIRDVDEILDEVVEFGSPVLQHVWDASPWGEKAIMVGMVAAMSKHRSSVGTRDINRAWRTRCGVAIPEEEMERGISGLIKHDIIVGQDRYMFRVDLQRLWIQKSKRLEGVKEEIIHADQNGSSSGTLKQRLIPSSVNIPLVKPLLFAGLILVLILVSSLGLFYYVRQSNNVPNNEINAANKIATVQAQATNSAEKISTEQAQATNTILTVTAASSPEQNLLKQYTSGNPDPTVSLSGNDANNWDNAPSSSGERDGCYFTGGVYYASISQPNTPQECFAKGTNFSNFAYQVQMTIVNGNGQGDGGGLIFRAKDPNSSYRFRIGTDGTYDVFNTSTDMNIISSNSPNSAIIPGLNQPNVLTVIESGSMIYIYVNGHFLAKGNDITNNSGEIGLFAFDYKNHTKVKFSDAKVWRH
jgi:DNA-binding response OmpR family regulator